MKKRPKPHGPRSRVAPVSLTNRSRITNGQELLPNVDGRSTVARRYRDIASDQGGPDQCSESCQQLIRRFAAAAVIAEQLEAKLARGETIDITEHALLVSTLVRVAQRIGIDRIPKMIVPTLNEYLVEARSEPDDREAAE
jgi:hypothetical protein